MTLNRVAQIEVTTLSDVDFRDDFFATSTNPAKK